jgi:hypothetical protein
MVMVIKHWIAAGLRIHLISYNLCTAVLAKSHLTHLESYIKMDEFHPTITQKLFDRNFGSVYVINPQTYFLINATSTETKSLFLELSYLCCWNLQKFSLHINMADYMRLKYMYFM